MSDKSAIESIVFIERNTFPIEFRRPSFPHHWTEYSETTSGSALNQLRPASIVICNKYPLRKAILEQLPDLRLIAVAATGVDNIDLEFCRSRQIVVCNARGYATGSVPEHVLMMMLALRRNLVAYRDDVEKGKWREARQFCLLDHPINDLRNSTLGIVGYGRLGQSLARLAQAIGMNVLVAERKKSSTVRKDRTLFEEVLKRSDVLSLHCPLTDETKDLMGEKELGLMKTDAILINTARGGLINDLALAAALRTCKLGGAGIDVLREEPPVSSNILLEARLPNLIVTPHIAWASRQAMLTLAEQVTTNLEAFVNGEATNVVA